MADEVKTVEAPAADPEKAKGLRGVWEGDYFQHGLEKFDEASKTEAKKSDEDCPECEKERRTKEAAAGKKEERKPLRIAKVQGKEIPLYTEEEVQEYINKGGDYTQKTQALSEEKKDIRKENEEIKSAIAKFNQLFERLNTGSTDKARGVIESGENPADEADVPLETEYGYDPDMVDPYVPKLAGMLRETRKQIKLLEESNKLFLMDKIGQTVKGTIMEAVKTYPIEPITDDDGKDLTMPYFLNSFKARLQDPANKNKPIPEIAIESVRDLHVSQQKMRARTTQEVKSEVPSEDMPIEEFKAKHPKLFSRLSDQAVAEHSAKVGDIPPNPKSRGAEVDAKRSERKSVEGLSMRERLSRALDDPEISGALNPQ